MPSAYQTRPYDRSGHTARMGDLIRARGDVAAREASVRGNAWAGAVENIGQTVNNTMGQLIALKESEPRRRREQAMTDRAERADRREGNLEGVMQIAGQLPPEEAIKLLRQEGFTEEAGKMQSQLSQVRRDAIADQKAKLEVAGAQLNKAIDLLATVDGLPDAERPTVYSSIAPQVRELVGEDLGKMVPDTYDPQFVSRAMEWGMSAKEKLAARREALTAVRLDHKDQRDADEHFTKTLSSWLQTVDDQDEWSDALKNARDLGAPPETIAKFGDTFSPEAVSRAAAFTKKDRPPAAAGSLEDYVTVLEERKGRRLNDSELIRARSEYAAAGRAPDSGAEKGLTAAQLQAARDRRFDRLKDLKEKRDSGALPPGVFDEEAYLIESEYARATGAQPPPNPRERQIPADLVASEGSTSYERQQQQPRNAGGTMGELVPQPSRAPLGATPASAGPTQPAQSQSVRPSPDIEAALKQAGPGEYDLRDGSTWRVYGDGRMERVK